jgi:uncharacterized protein YukE
MRILVDPYHLRALARQLDMAADSLQNQTSSLGSIYARLQWEVHQQASIDGQIHRARHMATELVTRLEAMAHYVRRKADMFEEADRQGLDAVARAHGLHTDIIGRYAQNAGWSALGASMALGRLARMGHIIGDVGENLEGMVTAVPPAGGQQSSEEPRTYNPTTMQEMVELLEGGEEHIRIMKVGENDYVVLLKGTEFGFGRQGVTHDITGAVHGNLELSGEYESLVREAIEANITDTDANIHFVGHSLGGMIANNLADNQDFRDRYPNLQSVTTFGSPANVREAPGVEYTRYWNSTDVVPSLNPSHLISSLLTPSLMGKSSENIVDEQIGINSGHINPKEAHNMKNYALALEHEATPAALEHLLQPGQTWQETASISADRESNDATDIISALGIFRPADMAFETIRTVNIAAPTYLINEITSTLPADHPLYIEIDRWNDRYNQFIMSKPTPSEVAGGIIDGTVNIGGKTIDAAGDALGKGTEIAGDVADTGKDVVRSGRRWVEDNIFNF